MRPANPLSPTEHQQIRSHLAVAGQIDGGGKLGSGIDQNRNAGPLSDLQKFVGLHDLGLIGSHMLLPGQNVNHCRLVVHRIPELLPGLHADDRSTGILAGRKDLIEAALMQASPNSHLGRGMKVGKEEIIGLIVALNRYERLDHEALEAEWARKARYIVGELSDVKGLTAAVRMNTRGFAELDLAWVRIPAIVNAESRAS